jgi:hypothetical protein
LANNGGDGMNNSTALALHRVEMLEDNTNVIIAPSSRENG